MKVPYLALLLPLLSATTVDAVPANVFPFPKNHVTTKTWTFTAKSCSTSLASKPCGQKRVPTTSVTRKQTIRPVIYKTVTPTTWSTPTSIVTVQSTVTQSVTDTITLPPVTETSTDTVSETSTFSETTTVPSSTTVTSETVETTTVTQQETVTIPEPEGFRYPTPGVSASFQFKKRDLTLPEGVVDIEYNPKYEDEIRNELEERSDELEERTYNAKKKFPVKVTCTVYLGIIRPITSTRTAKTKTFFARTTTITRTSGSSILFRTTFVTEGTTTTLDITATDSTSTTGTETVTTPSTVTESSTSTVTETAGPTYYAACDSRNLINRHPDGRYLDWTIQSVDNVEILSMSSPYECCAACMRKDGCYGARFDPERQRCTLGGYFNPQNYQCPPQRVVAGYYRAYDGYNEPQIYLSNGKCGQWQWQNS